MLIHVKHKFGRQGFSKVDTVMKFKMMYSFLNSDLDIIEKTLEEAVQADSALLRQASLHILQAGGKTNTSYFCSACSKVWNITISIQLKR